MAFFERSSPSERRSRAASTQSVADLEQNRPTFPRLQQSAVIILGQPPSVQFYEPPTGLDMGWHGVRHPQIVIILSGVFEIETGDGEKRQWRAGEIFVADDTDGKHLTRVVEGPYRTIFVRLPTDFVIEQWSS